MQKILPPALLEDLKGIDGFDKVSFVAAHQQPAITSVRLHPVKGSNEFSMHRAVPWCSTGRYLEKRPVFTLDPAYHGGAYYVQEASSMFLEHMLRNIIPGSDDLRVLDLCAAPGGKSTLVSSLLGPGSLLISNDVIRARASILEENVTRWGYMNTWVTSNDPRDFGKLQGYFDVIIIDAPCSGSGLFRKDARALDEWSNANVQLCSQRQQRILADVWPALKENGILIYATCSYSPQEDDDILDWIGNEFEIESLNVPCREDWGITNVLSPLNKTSGYRFFPGKTEGEGFFIAAMRKLESTQAIKPVKFKTLNNKLIEQKATQLINRENVSFIEKDKDHFFAINKVHEADYNLLQKTIFIRKAGLPLGMPTMKEWVPDHALALSIDLNDQVACIEVNKEQALLFLKKEEFITTPLKKGWYVVRYGTLGLGWVKSVGMRMNNYLPKHWRIRMEITDADWA